MEKKIYEKPAMQLEEFIANEYCENCQDDSHTMITYYFYCNAGEMNKQYYIHDGNGNYQLINGKFYGPENKQPRWYHDDSYIYHPCGEYHEITLPKGVDIATEEDIITGLYLDDSSTRNTIEKIEVVLWTQKGTNMHATVNTNPHQWQTSKS